MLVNKFKNLGRHKKSNINEQISNSLNEVGYSAHWNWFTQINKHSSYKIKSWPVSVITIKELCLLRQIK